MRGLALLLCAVILVSGCSSKTNDNGGGGSSSSGGVSGSGSSSHAGGGTGTSTSGGGSTSGSSSPSNSPQAHLTASVRNGTAPLAVIFGITATGGTGTKWTMEFGEGAKVDGTKFPGSANHTYLASGTFIAKVTVTFSSGPPAQSSLSIGVLPAGGVATGGGYHLNVTSTIAFPQASGFVGCNGPSCPHDEAKTLYDTNPATNGTWFLWYNIPVAAGARSVSIHAGSTAAQTCDPAGLVGCEPDFDIAVLDAKGSWTDVASASDYEFFAAPHPAPGTWGLVIIYFDGPPQGATQAVIDVNY